MTKDQTSDQLLESLEEDASLGMYAFVDWFVDRNGPITPEHLDLVKVVYLEGWIEDKQDIQTIKDRANEPRIKVDVETL